MLLKRLVGLSNLLMHYFIYQNSLGAAI